MAVRIFFLCVVVALPMILGGVILQVYLSRLKIKWLGLILPGCTVWLSLIAAMIMSVTAMIMFPAGDFTETWARVVMTDDATGETVFEERLEFNIMSQPTGAAILPPIMTFLLFNIPTAVLLVIYVVCRAGLAKNRETEKTGISDL